MVSIGDPTPSTGPGSEPGASWYLPSDFGRSALALVAKVEAELRSRSVPEGNEQATTSVEISLRGPDRTTVTRSVTIAPDFVQAVDGIKDFLALLADKMNAVRLFDVSDSLNGQQLGLYALTPNPLIEAMNRAFAALETATRSIRERIGQDNPDLQAYRTYTANRLAEFTDTAAFCREARLQLSGAGSYKIINYILDNSPSGSTLLGCLLDRLFLDAEVAQALRQRVRDLASILDAGFSSAVTRFESYACGPARGYVEWIRPKGQAPAGIHPLVPESFEGTWSGAEGSARLRALVIDLLDLDEAALGHARAELIRQWRARGVVPHEHQVRADRANAFRRIISYRQRGTGNPAIPEARDPNPPDFLDCSGLIDYLTKPQTESLTASFYDDVRDGGFVLLTAVAHNDPHRGVREMALNWPLVTRGREELIGLARYVRTWSEAVGVDRDASRKPPKFDAVYRSDITSAAQLTQALREGSFLPGQFCVIDGHKSPGGSSGLNQYLIIRKNDPRSA